MTLAPRVEVFTQLSCHRVYDTLAQPAQPAKFSHRINNTSSIIPSVLKITSPVSALGLSSHTPESEPFLQLSIVNRSVGGDYRDHIESNDAAGDPQLKNSNRCVQDTNVQAGAAKMQMIMTTSMGLLSALTTGWWGHFGERYGRTRVLAISTLGLFLTCVAYLLEPLCEYRHFNSQ
jgi:MFS family permease